MQQKIIDLAKLCHTMSQYFITIHSISNYE